MYVVASESFGIFLEPINCRICERIIPIENLW